MIVFARGSITNRDTLAPHRDEEMQAVAQLKADVDRMSAELDQAGLERRLLSHLHEAIAAAEPERFFIPPYIGPKGWVGLDLDGGDIDWKEIEKLVHDSYRLVAPKRLATLLE